MSVPDIDRHQAHWLAAHAGVPDCEVHVDDDATWVVAPGSAWGNAAAMLRFSPKNVDKRLDSLVARYKKNARGTGFWVGPHAKPSDIEERLKKRGLRCRKRFPGMAVKVRDLRAARPETKGVSIDVVSDRAVFKAGHPGLATPNTPIRKYEHARVAFMTSRKPATTIELVATTGGRALGVATLHLSDECAGIHDVVVAEDARKRGIGGALVRAAVSLAGDHRREDVVLISSGMGESVYRAAGFETACEMAFFYRGSS